MISSSPSSRDLPSRCGFTLIEVVIAIGVFTIACLPLVALLAMGNRIDERLTGQADRVFGSLAQRVRALGAAEVMPLVASGDAWLAVYQIRVNPEYVGDPESIPSGDDLRPKGGTLGTDYVLLTVVRRAWNPTEVTAWTAEADAIEPPALVFDLREETPPTAGPQPTYFLDARYRSVTPERPAVDWPSLDGVRLSRRSLPLVLRP